MSIFYDVNLNKEQTLELFKYAKEVCKDWWFDELDCSISIRRRKIEKTFEEALKFYDNAVASVIYRENENYLEVGFHTLGEVGHFLWIIVPIEYMDDIVEKFKLDIKPVYNVRKTKSRV